MERDVCPPSPSPSLLVSLPSSSSRRVRIGVLGGFLGEVEERGVRGKESTLLREEGRIRSSSESSVFSLLSKSSSFSKSAIFSKSPCFSSLSSFCVSESESLYDWGEEENVFSSGGVTRGDGGGEGEGRIRGEGREGMGVGSGKAGSVGASANLLECGGEVI